MFDKSTEEKQPWTYKEPIGITKEQWVLLLEDSDIMSEEDIRLLKVMYDCDGCMATGGQLARLLDMPYHGPINLQVGRLGKRIVKTLNVQAPKQRYGEGFNWWHVLFWGMGTSEGFYWSLRPELRDAMSELYPGDEIHIPEEIDENIDKNLFEGAKTQIFVNSYERNRIARERCIKHYGTKCVICGFDFEERYGEVGRDVIHVHHLKPLHEIGETYRVDPLEDLRPVCPNCHVIIHRRNPPHSIDEVKDMIKENAKTK
jgi:5-methylcytosine-specific restriction enzyme A